RTTCSAASEIAAIAVEQAFYALKAPVKRVTVKDIAIPYSPPLEKVALPDEQSVVNSVREVMRAWS
ncbi:MAG: transketolase C-terminal domain-containing protein, partial [Burkholderiales bacterium]